MADTRHTEDTQNELYDDPFSDRQPQPRQTRFNEPISSPRPYESTTSLAQDTLHDPYEEDENIEKQPLNVGQNFTGGFYPPA